MFPEPPRENVKPVASMRDSQKAARPSYTVHKGKRVACNECVVFLHEHGGKGPHVRSARVVRKVGKEKLFLCQQHGDIRKKEDGK